MPDIAQGLLTLCAVIVGGIVSFIGASLTERRRWARERSSRWDQRRLDAYVDYARALKNEGRISLRIASGLGVGTATDPIALKEGLALRQVAEHERSSLFEALLLLGDPKTVAAARVWKDAGWDVHLYLLNVGSPEGSPEGSAEGSTSGPPTVSPSREDFDRLYALTGKARDEFYKAARDSLEIINGDYVDTNFATEAEELKRRY